MATIVLVDDDELVCEMIAAALEEAAHRVVTVLHGSDAIDCVWENDPDLVILDCALPGKGGLPILQELRASPKFQTLPILILTSRRSDWHARLALETGASDYVRKPFKVHDVVDRVAALLDPAAAARSDTAAAGASTDLLVDLAYIDTLNSALGPDDTRVLLTMMASTLDHSIAALAQSLATHDDRRVAEQAHALAGAAKTVGATRLAALCRTIEHDPIAARALHDQLLATGATTKSAIEQLGVMSADDRPA